MQCQLMGTSEAMLKKLMGSKLYNLIENSFETEVQ